MLQKKEERPLQFRTLLDSNKGSSLPGVGEPLQSNGWWMGPGSRPPNRDNNTVEDFYTNSYEVINANERRS